jgi:hypothetical protein
LSLAGEHRERLWQIDVLWRVDLASDADARDSEQATYSTIVSDYGGRLIHGGHALFRRYRQAEICARSLRVRLGVIPAVSLVPSA